MSNIPITSSKLSDFDSSEKTAFMRKIYDLHIKSAAGQRDFVGDLSEKELVEIESGIKARKDAALACQHLLTAARQELEKSIQAKSGEALGVKNIGVTSGYRSAQRQFSKWREYFPKYYTLTADKRKALAGGAHGDAASSYLRRFIATRLAAPGFSLHNSGIAIDFRTTEGGRVLGPSKSQTQLWKNTWFFKWLTSKAKNFGFYQNEEIDEPWHWELKGKVSIVDFAAEGDEEEKVGWKCTMEDGDDYPV